MSREILFRGQTRKYGEKVRMNGEKLPGNWVYGGIFPGTGDYSIIYGWKPESNELEKFIVYSDTVGQYTGLTDRNGKKIFEGDLLNGFVYPFLDPDGHAHNYFAEVCWDDEGAVFYLVTHKYPMSAVAGISEGNTALMSEYDRTAWEVIGNIHDNPELLKEG